MVARAPLARLGLGTSDGKERQLRPLGKATSVPYIGSASPSSPAHSIQRSGSTPIAKRTSPGVTLQPLDLSPTGARSWGNPSGPSGCSSPSSGSGTPAHEKPQLLMHQNHERLPRTIPEFLRYGQPRKGAMGSNNMKQVCALFKFKGYIDAAEHRCVTLPQLAQVQEYAQSHCREWKLDVDSMNMYDINNWIIKPATQTANSAFVEHFADKGQLPAWFVSHWWEEPDSRLMACLRHWFAVRHLAPDTCLWVSAYANRQHSLEGGVGEDLQQSSIVRAMHAAKFRVILVLNSATSSAVAATPFKRIWCVFECACCLDQASAPMDIVFFNDDRVELITRGATKKENTAEKYLFGTGVAAKVEREKHYPFAQMLSGLSFDIASSESTVPSDLMHILNRIVGRDLNAMPLIEHARYEEMNKRLRGLFALMFWSRALAESKPSGEVPGRAHDALMRSMSSAIRGDEWRKSLSLSLAACRLHEPENVDWLASSLPPRLQHLTLDLRSSGLTDDSLEIIADAFPETLVSLSLELAGCEVTSTGVLAVARKLPPDVQSMSLGSVQKTKISDYVRKLCNGPMEAVREQSRFSESKMKEIIAAADRLMSPRQIALAGLLKAKMVPDLRVRLLGNLAEMDPGQYAQVAKAAKEGAARLQKQREQEAAAAAAAAEAAAAGHSYNTTATPSVGVGFGLPSPSTPSRCC